MPSPSEHYAKLEPERVPYEEWAEDCAKITIPSLFRRSGIGTRRDNATPFNSAGAHGVNNLASAMLLGLLPPGYPFFRLKLDAALEAELRAIQEESMGRRPALSEVEAKLALWEKAAWDDIERANYRPQTETMNRLLLVTGNTLNEHRPHGGMRLHKLHSYVVDRNPDDSVARIVLKECKRVEQIEPELLMRMSEHGPSSAQGGKVDLFTEIQFSGDRYRQIQQIDRLVLDDDEHWIDGPADECPFEAQRFRVYDDEPYGRGLVEEYYGDLGSAETLTQAMVEAAAAAAKVLFFIQPGSATRPQALAKAKNLGFISGNSEHVTTLQVNKQADMTIPFEMLRRLNDQLDRVFVVARVRDAERVTTEEIRFTQEQLERAQGGVFSRLAQEFQAKLVRHAIRRLDRAGALPPLPENLVQPVIITGVHALGRSTEAQNMIQFVQALSQALGQQVVAQIVNSEEFARRLGAAMHVDPLGLVRTAQELQAMAQAAQAQALQQQAGSAAIEAGREIATKGLTQTAAQEAA